MRFDIIASSFSETFDFFKSSFKPGFGEILKIYLVSMTILLLTLLTAFVVLYFGFQNSSSFPLGLPGAAIFAFAIFILGAVLSSTIGSVNYNFVDARLERKPDPRIVPQTGINLWPMIKYLTISLLIRIILLIPIILITLVFVLGPSSISTNPASSSLLFTFLDLFIRLFWTIISALLYLFTQFAIYEVLLTRRGVIDSFVRGYKLVRKNLPECIIFSLVMWAVEVGISAVFVLPILLFGILSILLFIAALQSQAFLFIFVIPAILITLTLFFLEVGLMVFTLITSQNIFWKKLNRSALTLS